jgi:hypothetical protein
MVDQTSAVVGAGLPDDNSQKHSTMHSLPHLEVSRVSWVQVHGSALLSCHTSGGGQGVLGNGLIVGHINPPHSQHHL